MAPAPAPNTPALNVAFPPRPSVMDTPYTNTKSSTLAPTHIPNNVISHAAFLQDSEPLDPSYKRILESPTHHPIHLRSIVDTHNVENDTPNNAPVHGEVELQTEMSPAIIIITAIALLVLLFIGLFACDKYLSYREKVKMKKQQEEERCNTSNDAEIKESIQESELMEIDLGGLGVAVVEHVEYADVESVKEAPKERHRSGSGWMRFWR